MSFFTPDKEPFPAPHEQDPTQAEIQAVVDQIDLLIAALPEPPYDIESLPKTAEELLEQMMREGKALSGMYPAIVPTIDLVPVDDLLEFGMKRYPRESAAHHSGIAQIQRRSPLSELGPSATKYEVIHIGETASGLEVHREFGVYYGEGRESRPAAEFFWEQEMHEEMGMNLVSSSDLDEIKRQLCATQIMI